jgi:hypothetical protein
MKIIEKLRSALRKKNRNYRKQFLVYLNLNIAIIGYLFLTLT